ncbi:MAG: hypothetical protein PWQ46_1164 [Methanomicrobiaceae archaeon]|nr:hypothetical protein [Methanomicrobiaceae archaeon]
MNIGAVLIDIDGVLHAGDRPVEGAWRALRELDRRGIPYRFVSSTTRSSRHSVAQRLHRPGYEIPEPWIVTAAVAAAVHLRESGRTRCCGMKGILVRTGKYREEAVRRSGITPDLVIDSLADLPDHI